ncbi:uncharacterized protein MONBRDRAFT_34190 [Monosiga brevicollis MX1]|uniref:Cleavage and polyadenylation specificity factor subunit 2 n=1 Tax=Monosiga brevicollis TaxID=81824 RepID=A9VA41_MONBE|nr:uncharacterized protein MONBRDRAFT_34190 [Monosiga brevicollis MX1]EDQ85662.1 predicted protein [Monosiga brevicollis MX1]|eukprot:XP_001749611.1 hypothetical protein [Monosiga brevicollis MX1]
MAFIVRVEALSGVLDESPPCYLLELDGVRILLDCGWSEHFDTTQLDALAKVASTIDLVLLSQPDIHHLGALPYAYEKLGLTCPCYATLPIKQLGLLFLYDAFQARMEQEDFETFSLDGIDESFANITSVKYSQAIEVAGTGITLLALQAGHMLGGTVWRITKDDEDVVYALNYNHRSERHLRPAVFQLLTRPSLLITGARNASTEMVLKPKEREAKLLSLAEQTMRSDGTMVVVADTAGRTLELVQLFESHWNDNPGLKTYPVFFLSHNSYNVLEFAQTLIEFMSDKMLVKLQTMTHNPFACPNIKCQKTVDGVMRSAGAKVVIVPHSSLEAGFGRELLFRLAGEARNRFLFIARPPPHSLGARLLAKSGQIHTIQFEHRFRVQLEGEELKAYRQHKAEEAKQQKEDALAQARAEGTFVGSDSEDDEDEDDHVADLPMRLPGTQPSIDAVHHTPQQTRAKDRTFRSRRQALTTFPFQSNKVVRASTYDSFMGAQKVEWDDYGMTFDREKLKLLDSHLATGLEAPAADEADKPAEDSNLEAMQAELTASIQEAERPSKVVAQQRDLSVRCQVEYLDLEGLSDRESMLNILERMRPRFLVLLHGTEDETEELADSCVHKLRDLERIVMPKRFERVDIAGERNIFQLRLRDALVSSLKFSEAGEYKIAWIDGVLAHTEGDETSSKRAKLPQLEAATEAAEHNAVFVGDIRLSQLKTVLENHQVEVSWWVEKLVCNNQVVVGKDPLGGSFSIDGPLCETYYKVRELLYQQFVVA